MNKPITPSPLGLACILIAGRHLQYVPVNRRDAEQWGAYTRRSKPGEPWAPYPYGVDVWGSSVVLAEYILKGPSLAGKTVMDLGCGQGLAGIAAGLMGAAVTFADYFIEQARAARHNAQLNGVTLCRASRVNWEKPVPRSHRGRYDLVLAGDVMYSGSRPLLFIQDCLAPLPAALGLIATPLYRPAGDRDWKPFFTTSSAIGNDGDKVGLWELRADSKQAREAVELARKREAEISENRARAEGVRS